jgi:hypothetical protein
MDIGDKWIWQGPWAHMVMSVDIMWRPTPHVRPYHVTYLWESLSKASPPLIQCRFASRAEMEVHWIHGSTVIHLKGSNRLLAQTTDLPAMQPPLGGYLAPLDVEVVQGTVGRRP